MFLGEGSTEENTCAKVGHNWCLKPLQVNVQDTGSNYRVLVVCFGGGCISITNKLASVRNTFARLTLVTSL